MDATESLSQAQRLATIPEFPGWSQPAVGAIADKIAEWCEVAEDGVRLVDAAIETMPKWGGIFVLKSIYDSQHDEKNLWVAPAYFAEHEYRPEPRYDPGPTDKSGCGKCNKTGAIVEFGDNRATARLCECAVGVQGAIRHVAALNRAASLGRQRRKSAAAARRRSVDHQKIAADINTLEGIRPTGPQKPVVPIKPPSGDEVLDVLNRPAPRLQVVPKDGAA